MEEKKESGPNYAFIKLCVSLAVLGLALILRAFYPDQTRRFLQSTVAVDYTALLDDVGGSLRAFMAGSPEEAAEEGGEESGEDKEADENVFAGEPDPLPMGGFDQPVLWADARFLISELDGEDDTLPLPFGMQKPERVEYEVFELPFETAAPVSGVRTSFFGYRIHPIYGDWRFHYGIDIANASGTPIAAFASGTVAATGSGSGYGNYLLIEHEDGYVSLYAHCKKVTVRAGEKVSAGEKVAEVGSTGLSTGPHLHFELRRGGAFLDPAEYL